MKAAHVLDRLRDALSHVRMTNAEFGSVWRDQGDGPTAPVKFADGRLVTEQNVTEFIRERTKCYRDSWCEWPIIEAMQEVQSELPHKFESELYSNGTPGYKCQHCNRPVGHRSHTK